MCLDEHFEGTTRPGGARSAGKMKAVKGGSENSCVGLFQLRIFWDCVSGAREVGWEGEGAAQFSAFCLKH